MQTLLDVDTLLYYCIYISFLDQRLFPVNSFLVLDFHVIISVSSTYGVMTYHTASIYNTSLSFILKVLLMSNEYNDITSSLYIPDNLA